MFCGTFVRLPALAPSFPFGAACDLFHILLILIQQGAAARIKPSARVVKGPHLHPGQVDKPILPPLFPFLAASS